MTADQATPPATGGVTVLVPTYNRRVALEKAVRSALEETRIPILVHIFDNASQDDTEAFARALVAAEPRVRYTRRETNIGPYDNYGQAFLTVETPYFVPLADDDWLLPDFLHDAFQIMESDPELGATIFVSEARYENGEFSQTYPIWLDKARFGRLTPQENLADWMSFGHYHWSSVLWRNETLRKVAPPYMCVSTPSDVDFQAQVFCQAPVYLKRQLGAVYLLHETQISLTYDIRQLPSWVRLVRRLDAQVAEKGIFAFEEYERLRKLMLARFNPLWNIASDQPFAPEALLSLAEQAGFDLGDWDLAFALIDRLDAQSAGSERPDIVAMPDIAGLERRSQSRFEGRSLGIMRWLRDNRRAGDALTAEGRRLSAENQRLAADLDASTRHAADLAAQIAGLTQDRADLTERLARSEAMEAEARSRAEAAEAENASLRASTSWRLTAPLRGAVSAAQRVLRK